MSEKSVCCNAELIWENWSCDKNPEALIPEPQEHGNNNTCDDDYCSPQTVELDFTPSAEYCYSHECHSRCSKCQCLTGD